jgi:hypothetical protein
MKRTAFQNIVLLLTASFVLTQSVPGCHSAKQNKGINAPVPAADIPFQSFELNADSAATIHLATGTVLHIPAQAFAGAQSKLTLRIREFHTANDLLRAGIPMNTEQGALQSAGMLELRAAQNGKELQLDKDKTIAVELAGYRSTEGYNLYYLEQDRLWNKTGSFKQQPNQRKQEAIARLSILPAPPQSPASDSSLLFSLVSNYKVPTGQKRLLAYQWQLLHATQRKAFEQAMRVHWDEVRFQQLSSNPLRYKLSFTKELYDTSGNKRVERFSTEAQPLLGGRNTVKAQAEFVREMEAYNKTLLKIDEEKVRAQQQADLLQVFRIQKMGVWNIDKLMQANEMLITGFKFDFENELDHEINNVTLYAVYTTQNSVLPYKTDEWDKVRIPKGGGVKLVAVLPGNQVAYVEEQQLAAQMAGKQAPYRITTRRTDAANYLLAGK